MRIEIIRRMEKYIKATFNRLYIKHTNFSIISNNCWGTFVYKKFGLNYQSPFINLLIFAPDYIELLENFSNDLLYKLSFIKCEDSKHKDELISLGIYQTNYPIGILDEKYELHFLHYKTEEDAKNKWLRRVDRINFNKLIFKFSDGDGFEESMIKRFDDLDFKNKICFTSKKFEKFGSVIYLEQFNKQARVRDEWKVSKKEFDVLKFINNLEVT